MSTHSSISIALIPLCFRWSKCGASYLLEPQLQSTDGRQGRWADRLLRSLWTVLLEPFDQDRCRGFFWHYQSSVMNSPGQTAQGWMVADTWRGDRGIRWQFQTTEPESYAKNSEAVVLSGPLAFFHLNASFSPALSLLCVCVSCYPVTSRFYLDVVKRWTAGHTGKTQIHPELSWADHDWCSILSFWLSHFLFNYLLH